MDFNVGEGWISINKNADIPIGTKYSITNKSSTDLVICESNARPDDEDWSGPVLTASRTYGSCQTWVAGPNGAIETWIRVYDDSGVGTVNVQPL